MVAVTLTPVALADGETLTVEVARLEPFAGCSVSIDLRGIDEVATQWIANAATVVNEAGRARASWEISLGRETVLEVAVVRIETSTGERRWDHPGALPPARAHLNGTLRNPSEEDLLRRKTELEEQQRARYELPIGPSSSAGTYRALCVVERLLLTSPLRLAGVQLLPAGTGSSGVGEVDILNATLQQIGWAARVPADWWAERSRSNRPWTLIVMPLVRADDHVGAAKVASDERDHLLNLLALNRVASGRPIATVVESLTTEESWTFHEDEPYRGNLIGGVIAGENQADLLVQNAAVRADPLLALITELVRQAVGELNVDAAFFRYWSILELLAGARLSAGHVVSLINGDPWPTPSNTTGYAGPKVYELLKAWMAQRRIGEASGLFAPAADLLEAVQGWYARRNATAHYGAFRPHDPIQQARNWYSDALRTTTQGDQIEWLRSLREVVRGLVMLELHDIGTPLV